MNDCVDVLRQLQDILDQKSPVTFVDIDSSGSLVEEELKAFERYKKKKYLPIVDAAKAAKLQGIGANGKEYEIAVGPVLSRGKNLPSGKNLADYMNKQGRLDMLRFYLDHAKEFPTLFVLCQRDSARRVVEVGCE